MVRSRKAGDRLFDYVNIALLALIAFTSLAPVLHNLALSFSNQAQAASGMVTIWPKGFNLASYSKIMADERFFQAFYVSAQRVVLTATLGFIVTLLLAFPLSRTTNQYALRNVWMWLLVFVMMFNGGIIPFYMVIKDLHLINSIWALVLPGLVNVFNVILVVNFFRSIPREIDESAGMDGAGPWRMLFQIYMPLSLPVLATITLFNVVNAWNEFFHGLILTTRPSHMPLQTYVQSLIVQIDPTKVTSSDLSMLLQVSDQTLNAAKIMLTMLPILIIYPFLQRFFISGIMLGSVKE
ncbi:carbohydrate ABC transporter permease [Cohnella sp. GCM10027633]|uniref:carbohydrate ABC transporter permease n=1 Tax=unclassified Cohnella TaxID=2636738 RepID=UPI00363BA415